MKAWTSRTTLLPDVSIKLCLFCHRLRNYNPEIKRGWSSSCSCIFCLAAVTLKRGLSWDVNEVCWTAFHFVFLHLYFIFRRYEASWKGTPTDECCVSLEWRLQHVKRILFLMLNDLQCLPQETRLASISRLEQQRAFVDWSRQIFEAAHEKIIA